MSKPQPRRIPSDDLAITIDGEVFHPHEGEWVEVLAGRTVGELQATIALDQISTQVLAAQGEPDEAERVAAIVDRHFEMLTSLLAVRVVDWNWTDDLGRPLPKPDGTTGPIKRLQPEEINWLLFAGEGETPAARKNGSRPLATISSVSASAETVAKRSTGGRSHTRAS